MRINRLIYGVMMDQDTNGIVTLIIDDDRVTINPINCVNHAETQLVAQDLKNLRTMIDNALFHMGMFGEPSLSLASTEDLVKELHKRDGMEDVITYVHTNRINRERIKELEARVHVLENASKALIQVWEHGGSLYRVYRVAKVAMLPTEVQGE